MKRRSQSPAVVGGTTSFDLLGVEVDPVRAGDVVGHLVASSDQGLGGWVATVNCDILRQAAGTPEWAALLSQASLVVADGMPLVWASRLKRAPLPERVAGSELLYSVSAAASRHGLSVYLTGGAPGIADRAGAVLRERFANLDVLGTSSPTVRLEKVAADVELLGAALEQTQPDIVFCGFGFPKQELVMAALATRFPRSWFIGVGGSFAMAAGVTPPAPRWMRTSGLEWAHRLRLEPRRLFHRYVVDDAPFAVRLLASSLLEGLGRTTPLP